MGIENNVYEKPVNDVFEKIDEVEKRALTNFKYISIMVENYIENNFPTFEIVYFFIMCLSGHAEFMYDDDNDIVDGEEINLYNVWNFIPENLAKIIRTVIDGSHGYCEIQFIPKDSKNTIEYLIKKVTLVDDQKIIRQCFSNVEEKIKKQREFLDEKIRTWGYHIFKKSVIKRILKTVREDINACMCYGSNFEKYLANNHTDLYEEYFKLDSDDQSFIEHKVYKYTLDFHNSECYADW